MITLADVFREYGPRYLARYGERIPVRHRVAMQAVVACRSGALGAHRAACPACAQQHLLPHACRHRGCPRCGAAETERFIDRQRELLLAVPTFHLVFTVPAELRRLIRAHQRLLLGAISRAAVDALMALAKDPRHLGAQTLGALAVLHTWSRSLTWHPHVHLLVPAIGLAADRRTVVRPRRDDFLLPAQPLANAFRSRLLARIRRALPEADLRPLLFRKRWVVHLQPSLSRDPETLLGYLGRYIHRSPMAGKRIVALEPDAVVFSYRQACTNRRKLLRLHPHELIRRVLQHVPPKGLHRVRSYGLLHPRARPALRRLQLLLAARRRGAVDSPPKRAPRTAKPRLHCPACGHPALVLLHTVCAADCAQAMNASSLKPTARAPPSASPLLAVPPSHRSFA